LWKHIQKHGAKLDHNPSGKTLREYYHDSTRDGDGFQNQQELANLELLEAASTGDAEKVKELLSRHADINAMDASRKTPLHLAASKNHDLIVKLLCNHVANLQWELAKAIESGNYIVVKALIENGADISTDALHRAVYYRRGIIINLLLENGADVNLRQGGANKPDWHRTGITFEPLYMYSVLTPSYTKINFRDRLGGTPFDYCYFPFNETIANLLLEAGAIIEQYHWEAMPQWFRAWNAKYGPSPSSLLLGEFGNEFATLVGSEADQNTFQAIGGERWSL
jgi:ankyrin repeat protein